MEYLDVLKHRKTVRRFGERQIKKDIVIDIGLGYEMKEAKINSFRPGRVPLDHILTVSGD